MSEERPSILFITPGASRVGGNIVFLNFLKWFRRHSDIPFLTIYAHGGELAKEFEALGEAYQFDDDDVSAESLLKKGLTRVSQQLDLRNRRLRKKLGRRKFGLIYSNAVTNYRVLSALPRTGAPVISHCHELESVIERTGQEDFAKTKALTDHFVAVSTAVKKNLVENHGIDENTVDVIHGFIPIEDISSEETAGKRAAVFAGLGIPENAFVVGGSGTLYWRKAPEVFILTANAVRKKMPDAPIYFVWVGGAPEGDIHLFEMNFDIKKLGLEKQVRFLEHKADPADHYAALDIFLLTSREDPYPLVCLETAALGKPQICFKDSGGMPEFIEDDCGYTVPYLDIDEAAEKIIYLYENPAVKNSLGARAAQKARERHDIEIAAPRVLKLIEKYLSD
jgi:glycosyltransferase involved in cell wall biosynthesis